MVSKAAKLRAKRSSRAGRPRKEDAERFDCGKIKPEWTEKETKVVALDARKRIHKLDDGQFAGYTLGRIYLDGNITEEERKAGDEYAEQIARYYRLTGISFPSPRAQDVNRLAGDGGDVSEDRANRARAASKRYMALEGLLLSLADGPQVKQTVFNVCILDIEGLRKMPDRQMRWLRRGLRALHADKALR